MFKGRIHRVRLKDLLPEIALVATTLAAAFALRLFAATLAGVEVDEPIYQYAAAYTVRYGFPTIRATYGQPTVPFLYHPPFFFFLLAGWFRLFNTTDFFTARMLSVITSLVMLVLLYSFVRVALGKSVALLTLLLVGSDVWVIFTNQAVYIENSQMILILLAMWAYWAATRVEATNNRRYVLSYLVAGLLVGAVIAYKQIGVFLAIAILINLCLQRKHWLAHLYLFLVAGTVVVGYLVYMHAAFGGLFDTETFTQLRRTLGARSSPGLNYGPLTALGAVASTYWVFVTTILALVGGSILVIMRTVQKVMGKRQEADTLFLSWALGGVAFALGIALKSPHYLILWLIPLYIVISAELVRVYKHLPVRRQKVAMPVFLVCVLLINLWSFQARFLDLPGDTLAQADTYINATLPATAIVATENYIGVDITRAYVNIAVLTTPKKLFYSGATYAAFYWSETEPLPAAFGNINQFCIPLKTFNGFKDHVEVCQIDRGKLAQDFTR
ncbi:MAG TPA: glycosyltransferase family 39 protein [Ktedonobacterales bacterium]|nr:glycosyltransferase family 39 protein [Ktedonobacterales bacterium]